LRVALVRLPGLQDGDGGRAAQHFGAAHLLQRGDPARVVEVLVSIQDVADVLDLEAERADVCRDLVGRAGRTGVDEDVTRRRRDQHGADAVRADIVRVAIEGERILRREPFRHAGDSGSGGAAEQEHGGQAYRVFHGMELRESGGSRRIDDSAAMPA